MTAALAGRVEDAVGSLDEAAQRALAMREKDQADYRAIAQQLQTEREGVADLLVSARLGVWARLHDSAPPPRRTAQCGPARRVLAAQADGEAVSSADLERAREHVAGCTPCEAARLAMREAELACRTWRSTPADALPPPPPVSLERRYSDDGATQPARIGTLVAGRRRLVAAVGAVVLLLVVLAIAFGGGSSPPPAPAAPTPGPGSAQAPGRDIVPPPGDKFCPDGQRTCR